MCELSYAAQWCSMVDAKEVDRSVERLLLSPLASRRERWGTEPW